MKHSFIKMLILVVSLPLWAQAEASGTINNSVRVIPLSAFQFGYNPNPIVVNEGDKVQIIAQSTDVKHGFKIAEYKINEGVNNNQPTTINFIADKPGIYMIRCSVFCGSGHTGMSGELIVKKKGI